MDLKLNPSPSSGKHNRHAETKLPISQPFLSDDGESVSSSWCAAIAIRGCVHNPQPLLLCNYKCLYVRCGRSDARSRRERDWLLKTEVDDVNDELFPALSAIYRECCRR